MEEERIVSKRRKEIAAWAVANFKRWPNRASAVTAIYTTATN